MKLTGSTKRSDWERRWGHELPRDWGKGHIGVDGDTALRCGQNIATLILVALASGLLVFLIWGVK